MKFFLRYTQPLMIGRWSVLTKNNNIRNCNEKIENCLALKWEDYNMCTKEKKSEHVENTTEKTKMSSDDIMMLASMYLI